MNIFFVLLFASCGFMLIRNEWVSRQRGHWIDAYYGYTKWCIYNDRAAFNRYHNRCWDGIADYNTMMLRFWHWRFDAFVTDRTVYDAVLDHYEKQLEVVA